MKNIGLSIVHLEHLPTTHFEYFTCLCAVLVLADLNTQQRCNTVHPAERGERET